ncbi:MAG: hypothetical protein RI897_3749 [Verrucomicrobiota bacterium]
MAGFCGGEADLDRFAVAHFPDEDDFGGLAQGGAEAGGEGVEIEAEFALVKGGAFLWVDVFDGVFESDDMDGAVIVNLVEHGGESGGFAGAGGAGDEDESGFFLGGLLEDGGQAHIGERGDFRIEFAEDDGEVAALGEDIDAEPD